MSWLNAPRARTIENPKPSCRFGEGVWVHNDMASVTASGSASGSGSSSGPGISATGLATGIAISWIVTFGTGPGQSVKE